MNNYACILMPGAINALAAPAPEYGFPGLFFYFPNNLDPGLTYTIELSGTITDCSSQNARLRPVALGFSSRPDSAGVVITEVMFDPGTDKTEFVEVYNRSEHLIDLKDLVLARVDAGGTIRSFSDQQPLSYWLFPKCYAVFATDAKSFRKAWPMVDPAVVAERTDMLSLTNEESRLILMEPNQKQLDAITYSPDWHYPYLEDNKGVSLERINFDRSGTERANWFSSSPASGGSTPGSKNSSALQPQLDNTQIFTIDPWIAYAAISPDPVQLVVSYRFGEAGWFLRMNIFNSAGQAVRDIFPFGMAPMEGAVCWDGLDAAQRMVTDGIYLLVADYYHPSGKKGRWKKACAIMRNY